MGSLFENGQKVSELGRQRHTDRKILSRVGPAESDRMRMQKHAAQAEIRKRRVELSIAVAIIAGYRMAEMRGMHSYLMRSAGGDRSFDERCTRTERLDQSE